MSTQLKYLDGSFRTAKAIGTPVRAYPFANFGDVTHATYTQKYIQRVSAFASLAGGTADPAASGFYLVDQSQPESSDGVLCEFTRTYANIPSPHYESTSIVRTCPKLPGSGQYRSYGSEAGGNSGLIYQPDLTVKEYDLYGKHAVLTDSGFSIAATGGSYTLTVAGDTTSAIAYNATMGAIATAVGALSGLTAAGLPVSVNSDLLLGFGYGGESSDGFSRPFLLWSQNTAALSGGYMYSNKYSGEGPGTQAINFSGYNADTFVDGLRIQSHKPISALAANISIDVTNLQYTGNPPTVGVTANGAFMVNYNGAGVITGGSYDLTIGPITIPIYHSGNPVNAGDAWGEIEKRFFDAGLVGVRCDFIGGQGLYRLGDTSKYGFGIQYIFIKAGVIPTDPTSGNYRVTWAGQNIDFAANASAATIKTALEAATAYTTFHGTFGGTITVTKIQGQIEIIAKCKVPEVTITSSLTPSGAEATITGGRRINLQGGLTTRTITTAMPHGIEPGDTIYARQSGAYSFNLPCNVRDSYTVEIPAGTAGWSDVAATEIGRYITRYKVGSREYTVRRVSEYWLPGVSPGIDTAEDIPEPAADGTDTEFIDAHFRSARGLVPIKHDPLEYYLGPILCRKTDYISF